MIRNLAGAALAGAIAVTLGYGAGPVHADPELPAKVAAGLKEQADLCSEVEGTPDTASAVKRVDLTGDGKPDFVLFVGWIYCDGAVSIYGDREKNVSVYVGDAAGQATPVFNDRVYDVKLEGTGEAAKLWLTVTGDRCGKPPAPDFAHENFCERAIAWDAKSKRFEYAPVSTVRPIQ